MISSPGFDSPNTIFDLGMEIPLLLLMAASYSSRLTRSRHQELEAIKRISSMINRSLDLKSILSSTLESVIDITGMEAGTFRLSGQLPSPVTVYRGFSKETIALLEESQEDGKPLQRELTKKQNIVLGNPSQSLVDTNLTRALEEDGLSYVSLFPIQSGNRLVGTLGLASQSPKRTLAAQEDLIAAIGEIVGVAIHNLRLREKANKLSEDLVAHQEVNKIIAQSFDLNDVIRRIVIEGRRLVKTSQCHLFLLDERTDRLVGSASTQDDDLDIQKVEFALSESSIAQTALTEKRVIVVENIRGDQRHNPKQLRRMQWRAAIFVPLITKEESLGVLVCSDDSRERIFTPAQISRAETLAHQAALALENARLFQVVSRSQKEWETTFDALQDCVSVHDRSGTVVRANLALARRLDLTPADVIGKCCSELFDPSMGGETRCRHIQALESESLTVEELELPAMRGTFQISVSPWHDKNNRLAGFIHVAKDVSNEKLLQQQLIQSEKLSAIGELISGIAHELNNPLTGVMGYSQLLQLRDDLDERAKDSLLKINNLALRCQKIVQNLLSFARKQKPERRLSDINEILEKTVELRNYELWVNNIALVRELDPSVPKTIVDAHQVQQVFLNVITNAEQAMLESKGQGTLRIRTHHLTDSNRIAIDIVDNGPGIPETYLTKIFDPFFTTKEVGKGTGLGLSLSYGIIREHGGSIAAHSRIGEGSRFVIELPVIDQVTDDSPPTRRRPSGTDQFETLVKNKRFLVVDDERFILDFFVEVFRAFPVSVDTADNGIAAMHKMQIQEYDLIISDFRMPQMNGRDLFTWMKERCPQLVPRIIFVTGDTVSPETRLFFETNSSQYLAKPFKIEEVKEVIQRTLASVVLTER